MNGAAATPGVARPGRPQNDPVPARSPLAGFRPENKEGV